MTRKRPPVSAHMPFSSSFTSGPTHCDVVLRIMEWKSSNDIKCSTIIILGSTHLITPNDHLDDLKKLSETKSTDDEMAPPPMG